uniref:Uncharacterized protein n=1 Tax=Dunaliella tertiolecta TaxID=3047 RepID=A0A7S3QP59_DUNTE
MMPLSSHPQTSPANRCLDMLMIVAMEGCVSAERDGSQCFCSEAVADSYILKSTNAPKPILKPGNRLRLSTLRRGWWRHASYLSQRNPMGRTSVSFPISFNASKPPAAPSDAATR